MPGCAGVCWLFGLRGVWMAGKAITARQALCISVSASAVGLAVPALGAALFGQMLIWGLISALWLAVAAGWVAVAALSSLPKS